MNITLIKYLTIASLILAGTINAQTIQLKSGWNLIGITQSGTNGDIQIKDVVDKSKISTIYAPSVGNINTKYIEYNTDFFIPGYGYWVKVDDNITDANISFEGSSTTVDYSNIIKNPGWNLLSFTTNSSLKDTASNLKSNGFKTNTIYSPSVGNVNVKYIEYNEDNTSLDVGYYLNIEKKVKPSIVDTQTDLKVDFYISTSTTVQPSLETEHFPYIKISNTTGFSGSVDIAKLDTNTTFCTQQIDGSEFYIDITNYTTCTVVDNPPGVIPTPPATGDIPDVDIDTISLDSINLGGVTPILNSDGTFTTPEQKAYTTSEINISKYSMSISDPTSTSNYLEIGKDKPITIAFKIDSLDSTKSVLLLLDDINITRTSDHTYSLDLPTKGGLSAYGITSSGSELKYSNEIAQNVNEKIIDINTTDLLSITNTTINIDLQAALETVSASLGTSSTSLTSGEYNISLAISGFDEISNTQDLYSHLSSNFVHFQSDINSTLDINKTKGFIGKVNFQ